MKARLSMIAILAFALLIAACDSGEAELLTTSTLLTGTTETTDVTPTSTEPERSTTTILRGETVTDYQIAARISSDNGEIFYIVIPPGAYTDVDLENFIGDLKEADPDLWGAEVFDDEGAVQAFVIPEDQRTAEHQTSLDKHHFVSLVSGDTVKFRGPFAEFGEYVIGS